MKTVCFINGQLILREHKTGVHYFHEGVMKKICDIETPYNKKIAYFDYSGEFTRELDKENNNWIRPYICRAGKWPRIFGFFLPIEIFFGKNDAYVCDGFFPHTLFKAKKICIIHDLMVKIYPENYRWINKIYLNIFFWQLKKADLVICVSQNTKNDIIKYYGIDSEKIIVCYNGVDKLENKDVSSIKTDIDVNKRFIFYLGDMRKNKNLVNTVKGFLTFCSNGCDDLYFYIAGKKNGEYEQIVELLKDSPYKSRVNFLGYISDDEKYLLYEKCEAVMLVSSYEGFGMPIIEGMQHNKPVITSNCSSMKEVGEGAAVLTEPDNPSDIADAIESVYNQTFCINKEAYREKLEQYTFANVANIIDQKLIECL